MRSLHLCLSILFAILIFFAAHSLADTTAIGPCESYVLPPAISIDRVKDSSFTKSMDSFLSEMGAPFYRRSNVAQAQTQYATDFIARFLPELIQNHEQNRIIAYKVFTERGVISLQLNRNFANVDRYIARLQNELAAGQKQNLQEMVIFSMILVTSRQPEANRKLAELYNKNDENLVQARYPGKKLNDLKYVVELNMSFQTQQRFWTGVYGSTLEEDRYTMTTLTMQRFDALGTRPIHLSDFQTIMPVPTSAMAGYEAFFFNYFLPIHPIALPTEYELLDSVNLSAPYNNFQHDWGHYQTMLIRLQKFEDHNFFRSEEAVKNLKADLIEIKRRVEEKNDPELLKTLYFLFYFMRFESTKALPYTSEQMFNYLNASFDPHKQKFNVDAEIIHDGPRIFNLFNNTLRGHRAPAPSQKVFAQKYAEILSILAHYNLSKTNPSATESLIKKAKITAAYIKNLRLNLYRESERLAEIKASRPRFGGD